MDRLIRTVGKLALVSFAIWVGGSLLVLLALAFGRVWPSGMLAYWTEYTGSTRVQIVDLPRRFNYPLAPGEMPVWSPDGRQLAFVSTIGNRQSILVTDIYGGNYRDVAQGNPADIRVEWSPDGRQLVYDRFQDGNWDIYVVDACDDTPCDPAPRRLTDSSMLDARPSWSPDGQQIAFLSMSTGRLEVSVMNADGSGIRRLTQNSGVTLEAPQWSPDGSQIMISSLRTGNLDIFVMDSICGDMPQSCDGQLRNLTQHPSLDYTAVWSPDGEWVAFASRRDENYEIYVAAADGNSPPRNLTNHPAEDRFPVWSPDGRAIAFQSSRDKLYNDEIYVVDVMTGEQRRVTESFGSNQSPDWWPG